MLPSMATQHRLTSLKAFVPRVVQPKPWRGFKRTRSQMQACAQTLTDEPGFVVKICGVTCAEDAALAAQAGANFVGLIAWPKAKRSVSTDTARDIACAARSGGAQPVAVFVDESAEQIAAYCQAAEIEHVQLHGDDARLSLLQMPDGLQVVYVVHADQQGCIQTSTPAAMAAEQGRELLRPADWVLVDGLKGGSGEAFDWNNLQRPLGWASRGWLLAGGLHPGNVAEAVRLLHPVGVDVSSGVCGPDGLKKDPAKVQRFVAEARRATAEAREQQSIA